MSDLPQLHGLPVTYTSEVVYVTRFFLIAADLIVLAITWAKTYSQWREARHLEKNNLSDHSASSLYCAGRHVPEHGIQTGLYRSDQSAPGRC